MSDSVYDVLNRIIAVATKGDLEAEVRQANGEFFARSGQVKEDDMTFEARMSLFLEWYLFDRPLAMAGVTPLQYFVDHPSPEFTANEQTMLREMLNHQHSIFEFIKAKDHIVYVRDMANKQKLEVTERRGTSGFVKGAPFEARILSVGGALYFSGPMLFHPMGAKKFIKSCFKTPNIDVNEIIFQLAAMQLKFERYRHVPQEKIYCLAVNSPDQKDEKKEVNHAEANRP